MDESAPAFPDPTIEQRLPAPTLPPPPPFAAAAPVPTNSAPAAAPFAAPVENTGGPGDREVSLRPVADSGSKSKRPLMVALALITVLAAGIGAFIASRGTSADETAQLETDDAFSFSAATANARAAGSMQFEMSSTTPEGSMSTVAIADRGSQRISVTADMSQLTPDDSFFETPESVTMILDESTSTVYIGSEFFGLFSDAAKPWISMNVDDVDDGDSLDEIFANPFEMTVLFGEFEPVDLGLETIQGEELRHFQVPLSVSDLLADSGTRNDFSDLEGIEELDEVVYDVWVDEDNTIRRIAIDLVIAGQANGFDMWIDMSTDSVEIPLPAPAEVTDLEELFGSWSSD